jgi:hypothetical protein
VEFLWKKRWHFAVRRPTLPNMGRKQRKLVVTVTERWTFVFDDEGEAPATPPTIDSPAPAPPSSPDAGASALPAGDPAVTAPASTATPTANPAAGDDTV